MSSTNRAAVTYYLGDTDTYDFSAQFTNNLYASCDRTYTVIDVGTGTTADTSIFIINATTGILTIDSSDTNLHNSMYNLEIRAAIVSNNPASLIPSTFSVTLNYCKLTTLTIPIYSDIYYDIG